MKTFTASFVALALALVSVNGAPANPSPNGASTDATHDNAKYELYFQDGCRYDAKKEGDTLTTTATCGEGKAAVANVVTLKDGHLVLNPNCEYNSDLRSDGKVDYKEECPLPSGDWTLEEPDRKPECIYSSVTRDDNVIYKEYCSRVFEFILKPKKSDY